MFVMQVTSVYMKMGVFSENHHSVVPYLKPEKKRHYKIGITNQFYNLIGEGTLYLVCS